MIKDYSSIFGSKVLEFDSGDLLGMISGIIVHPDTGMVEAFWVKPTTVPLKSAVLKSSDILEFKKNLYVKSDRVLADAADIIQISQILEDGREFIGNHVQNEAGESYGRCIDLSFDTDSFALKQIHSEKSVLGLLSLDKRIFPYNKIVRVLPETVIINDDSKKKETLIATTPEAAAG